MNNSLDPLDPFSGGIQCAVDRILRIDALTEQQVKQALTRTDLQPSVRRHALDRLRRIEWTEKTSSLA